MTWTRRKTLGALFGGTLLAGAGGVLAREDFGSLPAGKRLERILANPYWQDGAFRNMYPLRPRPTEKSFSRNMATFSFARTKDERPRIRSRTSRRGSPT